METPERSWGTFKINIYLTRMGTFQLLDFSDLSGARLPDGRRPYASPYVIRTK